MSTTIDSVLPEQSVGSNKSSGKKKNVEEPTGSIKSEALSREGVDDGMEIEERHEGYDHGLKKSQVDRASEPVGKDIKRIPWDRYAIRAAAIVGAIIVWHLCSVYGFNFIISFENIPTPVVVFDQFLLLLIFH